MNALKSILSSDHGLIALALIIGATTLAALGIMPLSEWESYSQIIFGTFAASHAVISSATAIANRNKPVLAEGSKPAIALPASLVSAPTVTVEQATKSQAGYIVAPAILFMAIIGACLATVVCLDSCSKPCDPATVGCTAQNGAIACGETEVAQVVLDHGAEVEKVITGATSPADGSVNWSSIASQLEGYALKYGACVIAQIFDHYVSSKAVAVEGGHALPTPAAARDGFNQLRTKLWPGKTYKLSNGHVL